MTTDSQIAPDSPTSPAGARRRALLDQRTRWRLPIAYRAIASTALGVDLALILASATCAQAIYHRMPDELGGEYSHTIAAAIFVAILSSPRCGCKSSIAEPADGLGRSG